jgi:hypothetical protein
MTSGEWMANFSDLASPNATPDLYLTVKVTDFEV